ncbi:MAG: hypothetical protein HKN61_09240 [Flavobacteriaceae bacterium]|nr:hypothetical protein [Flavobacteriaceae bacterium]
MRYLFVALVFIGLLSGCSKDENKPELQGSWYLKSFQCCQAAAETYQEGDVTWTFGNDEILTVDVATEIDQYSQLPLKFSDTYEYTTTSKTVKIKTLVFDYYFEGNTLILSDSPETGGALIRFSAK